MLNRLRQKKNPKVFKTVNSCAVLFGTAENANIHEFHSFMHCDVCFLPHTSYKGAGRLSLSTNGAIY